MPITHSDRISGTIYVIARDAERAGNMALDYLRDKDDNPERDRVYAISLDIRIADEK